MKRIRVETVVHANIKTYAQVQLMAALCKVRGMKMFWN